MSRDDELDLEREERVGNALRRPVRDVPVAPFASVSARAQRRTPPVFAAVAGVAVIVLALIVGNALAERRESAAAPSSAAPTPVPSVTPSAAISTPPVSTTTPSQPSAAPTPTGTPIPMPNTAQIAAAGNGVVWALVAETHLFVSTDRGETWAERGLPITRGEVPPSFTIAFVNEREGWAMAAGSPATQCQMQGVTLWRTTDGARSWQQVTDFLAGMDPAQCKENLAFVDAQHGFISAWDPNTAPTIYRTSDGGRTWSGSRLPDPPGFTSRDAGFTLRAGPVADFGNVLYVAASGNDGTAQASYAFRSTDGGATWSYAARLPGELFVFLTPTHWIQIPQGNVANQTLDAGASWKVFQTDYSQAAPIAPQVVFGDAQTGYATVRGSIQRTTDGGAHWTVLKTPGT